MQTFTHFSRHAFSRVAKRTLLSCEEIARILDEGLCINTGRKPGFNRNHLLFHSIPDNDYFIAIQDGLTGTVVTILPLEYQANLAWEISDQDCDKARDILLKPSKRKPDEQKLLTPSVFVISGHFLDSQGAQKVKVIHKTASAPYKNDIKTFLNDSNLFAQLNEFADLKGIEFQKMFGLSIRLGNKGVPIAVDLGQDSYPEDSANWNTSEPD